MNGSNLPAVQRAIFVHRRQHRKLHVVNDFEELFQVSLAFAGCFCHIGHVRFEI